METRELLYVYLDDAPEETRSEARKALSGILQDPSKIDVLDEAIEQFELARAREGSDGTDLMQHLAGVILAIESIANTSEHPIDHQKIDRRSKYSGQTVIHISGNRTP